MDRQRLWIVIGLLLGTVPAFAGPVMDGFFDPNEGYTQGWNLSFQVEDYSSTVSGGEFWLDQDVSTGNVSFAFIQPLSLVDNSYGTNAVGWGSNALSGKNHNFGDLTGSDKLQIAFTDGSGATVFDGIFDYFTSSGGGYDALGVTGGDGTVLTGSASDVLGWSSSLDYNFNTLGHQLTSNSPLTGSSTTYDVVDSNLADWEFRVIYEGQLSGDLFAANGFGGVSIPVVHDSPNKIAKNKVFPKFEEEIPPVPEPSSLALLGLAAFGFLKQRRTA